MSKVTAITDAELGDPLEPQPDDPKRMLLDLEARDVQAVVGALNELPAKLSRRTLEKIETQIRATVLAARRARLEQRKAEDEKRIQAAAEKRAAKDARRIARAAKAAAKNGHDTAPAPAPVAET